MSTQGVRDKDGLCVASPDKDNCRSTEEQNLAANKDTSSAESSHGRATLDSGYSTGPDPTTPGKNTEFFGGNFFIGATETFEEESETFEDTDDETLTGSEEQPENSQPVMPKNNPFSTSLPATQPITIPLGPQSRQTPRPRHPDHTPPRGYLQGPGLRPVRFSTGCIVQDQLESYHQRTIATQTSVTFNVEQQIQHSIRVQEEARLCAQHALLECNSPRDLSESRVRTYSENLDTVEAGRRLTPRERSQSDPGLTMRRLHMERTLGQELRRISDEFHNERFRRGLFRIPEDREEVRPSSYPNSNVHQQGWWHRIIQFMSPNKVRPAQNIDDDQPPEPETGERQT